MLSAQVPPFRKLRLIHKLGISRIVHKNNPFNAPVGPVVGKLSPRAAVKSLAVFRRRVPAVALFHGVPFLFINLKLYKHRHDG